MPAAQALQSLRRGVGVRREMPAARAFHGVRRKLVQTQDHKD